VKRRVQSEGFLASGATSPGADRSGQTQLSWMLQAVLGDLCHWLQLLVVTGGSFAQGVARRSQ